MMPALYLLIVFFDRYGLTKALLLFLVCIIAIVAFTLVCIRLSAKLNLNELKVGAVRNVSLYNASEMPTFLGYFFVALSIPKDEIAIAAIVFAIILVFVFKSETLCYNPILLIFGYNYYMIEKNDGSRILIVTRQKNIYSAEKVHFESLYRLNNFTYLDFSKVRL